MSLVNDFLEQSAVRTPNKVALVCEDQRFTYGQINTMANHLANAFCANGVGYGDRVLLWLPNSVEMVVSIFATLKANGVFVPVDPATKIDRLIYLANHCRITGLTTTDRLAYHLPTIETSVPSLKFTVLSQSRGMVAVQGRTNTLGFDTFQQEYPAICPPCTITDQDLACLIYTSGSTGSPKGVMCAHSNVVFAGSSIIAYLENQAEDVILSVLPLSFDYGLYQLLMAFKFGGTLVLERSFSYPASVLQRMVCERVTGFPGVPTVFARLLQMDLSQYDLRHLRYITNTAAALSPSYIQKLCEQFPSAILYSMYGLTETKRALYLPPSQLNIRPDSVGIPIPGTQVWIENEEGQQLGPNEVGELVVQGRHVMRGYWEDPKATAERFRDSVYAGERICYTGDLFRMDDEGYYYFVGRKDDIIKSRGEKVAPKEVENVLYRLPEVVEAAVIGVPDPDLGEAIKAFVVTKGDHLTEEEIRRHCRANLENYKVPQLIELRKMLPLTNNGKIKKSELLEEASKSSRVESAT